MTVITDIYLGNLLNYCQIRMLKIPKDITMCSIHKIFGDIKILEIFITLILRFNLI